MLFKMSILGMVATTVTTGGHTDEEAKAAELAAMVLCTTTNCGLEMAACMAPDVPAEGGDGHRDAHMHEAEASAAPGTASIGRTPISSLAWP
jgi:hypothetical protein